MRKSNTLIQAIKRARKAEDGAPPVPKSWDEMNIPPNFRNTVRSDQFLALEENVQPDRVEKIIIFCSNAQKEVLDGADYWVADGTFEVVQNTLFSQLFIVHAVSNTGITVPCLYGLLPDKELTSYQRCFDYLKSQDVAQPGSLKTDFEYGIIRGFQNVYPGVPVNACDAHFKRSLRRKLTSTEIGLASLYLSNEQLQTLIRYTWALSLVPIDQIVPIWEEFIAGQYDKMSGDDAFEGKGEAVDRWLTYFERTYVGALNFCTGNRRAPIYPHVVWNKHNSILNNDASTTNAAEGYNAALKASLPRNNSIWTLIKQLRIEENSNQRKLRDVALGPQNNQSTAPNTSRNLARQQKKEELKQLVSNFSNMPISLFMSSVLNYYNDMF